MNENGPMRIHIGQVPIYAPDHKCPAERSNVAHGPHNQQRNQAFGHEYKMHTIERRTRSTPQTWPTLKDAGARAPSFNYKRQSSQWEKNVWPRAIPTEIIFPSVFRVKTSKHPNDR